MPFTSIRQLDGSLWIAGPREATPASANRRNRGVSLIPNGRTVRSRAGSIRFGETNSIIPLARFSNFVLGRSVPDLNVINVSNDTPVLTGTVGNGPLRQYLGHAIAPSVADNAATAGDFFYYADASGLYKLNSGFGQSTWGIEPPGPDTGMNAPAVIPVSPVLIDPLDATAGWDITDPTAGTFITNFATDSLRQIDGTSLHGDVDADKVGTMTKTGLALDLTADFTLNLASAVPVPATDEDWVSMALRLDKPRRLDSFQIVFGCDDRFNSSFSFDVLVDDRIGKRGRRSKKKRGLADLPTITNNEQEFKATTPGVALTIDVNDLLGDSVASSKDNTWARLRIPKLAFTENGDAPDWSNITAIRFVIRTNRKGSLRFYVDDLKLEGGVGMQGTYKYRMTYKNSVTGHRSNPTSDLTVDTVEVNREPVHLTGFVTPADPQVDTREFWRTIGNGEVYFKLDEIPIGDTEYFDRSADYAGLHTGPTSPILGSEVLPTDNIQPLPEYGHPVVHSNRMWWATGRRAYYSPPGRYESVQGFIDVTSADDAIKWPIRWDDQLFLLCENSVYVVLGSEEPFITRKLPGVPGTVSTAIPPAVALPAGIVYLTPDGPRILRGTSSQLLEPEPLAPIWQEQRDGVEGLSGSTSPTALTAERDRVYFSWTGAIDQTLIYDTSGGAWRDLGLQTMGGFYDVANDALYFGTPTLGTLRLGDETQVIDAHTGRAQGIPFVWEPAPIVTNADRLASCIRYVAFTMNTGGQLLTPTIIVEDVETTLPPRATSTMEVVEYPINRWGRVVGARLSGLLTTARVEIAEVAFDVYLPETHGVVAPTVEVPTPAGSDVAPRTDAGEAAPSE